MFRQALGHVAHLLDELAALRAHLSANEEAVARERAAHAQTQATLPGTPFQVGFNLKEGALRRRRP